MDKGSTTNTQKENIMTSYNFRINMSSRKRSSSPYHAAVYKFSVSLAISLHLDEEIFPTSATSQYWEHWINFPLYAGYT